MADGLAVGGSQLNTTDDVKDILIFISDGWNSFELEPVWDAAEQNANNNITTISMGNGFETRNDL